MNTSPLFNGWHSAIGSVLPFDPNWSFVVSLTLILAAFAGVLGSSALEFHYVVNVLGRHGSLRRNVALLAVYSVITPLLIALLFTAAFAQNASTASDFAAYWALAASWIVLFSLLFEAIILGLLIHSQRRTSLRI